MGVKFQTKDMGRTKIVGITFCKEFNIYNFIGVEEKSQVGKAKGAAAMFS